MQKLTKLFSKPKKRYQIVIVGSLPAYLGAKQHSGLGNVVWGLANELAKHQRSFAILARGKYYHKYRKINGIDVHGIGFSIVALFKTFFYMILKFDEVLSVPFLKDRLRLAYGIYFLLYFTGRMEFDLIHLHHVTNQLPLAARIVGIKKAIIAHVHSYSNLVNNANSVRFARIVDNISYQLSKVDFVVHVSRSVKKQGLDYGVKWPVGDAVIYNGARYDLNDIDKLIAPRQRGVLCFAGAFLQIKGVELFLDSLPLIKNHVEKIIWIGEGPLREEIVCRCREHDIEYDMTGMISNEKVLQILSSSQLLVLPSISESFGQVYLESLLVGTPAIGYHAIMTEFKELFDMNGSDPNTLIPFNSQVDDHTELADRIISSLQRPASIDRKLREKVLAETSWPNLIGKYLKIYDKLLREYSAKHC